MSYDPYQYAYASASQCTAGVAPPPPPIDRDEPLLVTVSMLSRETGAFLDITIDPVTQDIELTGCLDSFIISPREFGALGMFIGTVLEN